MQTETNNNFYKTYNDAVVKGRLSMAHAIASREALFCEERENHKQAGYWLHRKAYALFLQGRYAEGGIEAARSADIQPDPYERARSLFMLAANELFSYKQNKALLTIGHIEEIARTFRNDAYLHGNLYAARGAVFCYLRDIDQAFIDWENGIKQMLRGRFLYQAALQLNNYGFELARAGRLNEAEERLLRALELVAQDPHLPSAASIHDSIGYTYTLMGHYNEAARHLNKSANIFERLPDKVQLIGTRLHLSELYERKRDVTTAQQQAECALLLATEIGSEQLCTRARNRLASIERIPAKAHSPNVFHEMVYTSAAMQSTITRLKTIAAINDAVLILGPTGTGKELAARALHCESRRRAFPFVAFNCATLSRELIESRLFGHRKGAFTGADREHTGVIGAACGGTLLLDEIGDLPLEAQGALLRFLQSGEVQPVGASQPVRVDVRVVAATNRDLRQEVEAGRFRQDLYYRLNGVTLALPPLSARRGDVEVLARYFARLYAERYGVPEPEITPEEKGQMLTYEWPGNVRELENYIKQRVLFGEARLDSAAGTCNRKAPNWRGRSDSEKAQQLREALTDSGGNVTVAARQLGISRRAIQKFRHKFQPETICPEALGK